MCTTAKPDRAQYPVLVSVIIPAHNAAAVLERAVASVRVQTVDDWEVIISEDGSTDETAALAQTLAQEEPRVRVLHHATPRGAAGARNAALAAAQGRYIAYLDADDAWHPDKLARQLAVMQGQGAALSYTGFARVTPSATRDVSVPASVTRAQLLRGNVIGCSTAMYDRAVLGDVAMPDLRLRQDYALWLTLLARGAVAAGVQDTLVDIHVTPGSLSANKGRAMAATWAMHHRHFGVGPLRAAFYVAAHTLRRLWRG